MVKDLIAKSSDGGELSAEEMARLFSVSPASDEAALIVAASRRKSAHACDGKAEVHGQVGLNLGPCPCNCLFCSFAAKNGIFTEDYEFPLEDVIERLRQMETAGANALFVMSTARYPVDKFIEQGQEIRRQLKPESVLVANTGDLMLDQAGRLKAAGFDGIYHAIRMGEGVVTTLSPEKRRRTFAHAHEVGLSVGTCVEPVGPEHTVEELVEKTLINREARPVYSGSARRITIPGSELAVHGQISEARMALILAVVRLAMPLEIAGNCTHEPNVIGAAAGANLLWAETGANPRDTTADTEGRRGMSVADCRGIFEEADWEVLEGPSRFYRPVGDEVGSRGA